MHQIFLITLLGTTAFVSSRPITPRGDGLVKREFLGPDPNPESLNTSERDIGLPFGRIRARAINLDKDPGPGQANSSAETIKDNRGNINLVSNTVIISNGALPADIQASSIAVHDDEGAMKSDSSTSIERTSTGRN